MLLIVIVLAVLLILGYVVSKVLSQVYGQDYFFMILIISIIFSIGYIWISYFFSDKIALASAHAMPASPQLYHEYFSLVEGLTLASGLPMPRLYVMDNPQINAFASGRDPKNAVICVTSGALEKLNKQELEGVLSHELSHIANFDIRFMTLAAVLVGMISILAELFLRSLWYGSRSSNNSDSNKSNAILMVIGIILAILAPIMVQLVQLAISRRREYLADSNAVKFTRTPTGLIGALQKIKSNSEMKGSGAISPLFIASPKRLASFFQTHPPLEDRIAKLKRM
jgi:heat shock protein HtpX